MPLQFYIPSITGGADAAEGPGASSGSGSTFTGSWDDPNGQVTPTDTSKAAKYYKDTGSTGVIVEWNWSVSEQAWMRIFG